MAFGTNTFYFVSQDGRLFSCGNNDCGQLGLGTIQNYNKFQEIPLPFSAERKIK
jgi:alpha-tubulin suppressor-like RCC1 family protein